MGRLPVGQELPAPETCRFRMASGGPQSAHALSLPGARGHVMQNRQPEGQGGVGEVWGSCGLFSLVLGLAPCGKRGPHRGIDMALGRPGNMCRSTLCVLCVGFAPGGNGGFALALPFLRFVSWAWSPKGSQLSSLWS